MEISSPPITAMASGCSICDPAPSAKASGSMPQTAAMAVITMGRSRRCAGVHHGLARRVTPSARKRLVGIEQQDAVLGHDADDHDQAHERRHVEVGARDQQREDHAGDGEHGRSENGNRRGEVAELRQQHAEHQRQRQHQHPQQIVERLLLLLDRCRHRSTRTRRRQVQSVTACCTFFMAVPRSEPSSRPVTDDHALQVFAADFVLRRQLLNRRQRAERGGVARRAVEDGVLDGVERSAVSSGRRTRMVYGRPLAISGSVAGNAIEDGGGVFGDFGRREAEPRRRPSGSPGSWWPGR